MTYRHVRRSAVSAGRSDSRKPPGKLGNQPVKMRTEYTCPLELVHDMIKGKWKSIILWRLHPGATSLAKLERDIDGITQKMLLEQLKELMNYGFVEKKSYEGYPLHYEFHVYALDKMLDLEKGFLLNELYREMDGHILAFSSLIFLIEYVIIYFI